jgi:hypothetical protein
MRFQWPCDEEIDRLTDFLSNFLDVAEAQAEALRLTRDNFDLCELLRIMADLYEPSTRLPT